MLGQHHRSGRSAEPGTAPRVARWIAMACSGDTGTSPRNSLETVCCATPIAAARSSWRPPGTLRIACSISAAWDVTWDAMQMR